MSESKFLYEEAANNFQRQIEQRLLQHGDRLPSIRAFSKLMKISISTAYKAYYELERIGIIESRPRSGFYVRNTISLKKATGDTVGVIRSDKLTIDQIIHIVYNDNTQSGFLNLSVARPPSSLIPVAKLNKSVTEVLRKSKSSCTAYEPLQGNFSLRKQISRYAYEWGGQITPEDVVTTHGCMDAVTLCLKATTSPGDTVAIQSPSFFGLFQALKSLGLKILEIPSDPETGISLPFLKSAMEKQPIKVCLLVSNFNNPTGDCLPDHNKSALVKFLADREIPLIEDDIYGEMYFSGNRPKNCKSFDKKGLVLLCSSFSKLLAPGYRVGWCVPGKFKDAILNLKLTQTIASNSLTHAAITQFLDTGRYDLYLRRLRKALFQQCLQYQEAILKYFPGEIHCSIPKGGCVLWIELAKDKDALRLYQQAIQHHISIAPGHIFTTDGSFSNYFRITFSEPYTKEVDHGLEVLGKLIKNL